LSRWYLLHRISVRYQLSLMMIKEEFALIKNLRNSFSTTTYKKLNEDSFHQINQVYKRFLFQNFVWFQHFVIQSPWRFVNKNVFNKYSHLISHLIIKCYDLIFVNVRDLILLTFFHMSFDEISDSFYNWNNFSISKSLYLFSNRVFIKLRLEMKAYSWFKIIVNKKQEHLRDNQNRSI
jgi:hypothetical protein